MSVRLLIPLLLAITMLHAAHGSEVPFTMVDGFIVVEARTDAGTQLNLVLDSGASASVLGTDAAARLGVTLGEGEMVDGVEADAVAYHVAPVRVRAGDVPLHALGLVVDLHHATELCTKRVDGLIGADFFAGKIIQVDYAAGRMRLLAHAPAGEPSLRLRSANGVFCAPISVNGSHARWARLDTGCNDALHWVIPSTVARRTRDVSIGFLTDEQDATLVDLRLGIEHLPRTPAILHGESIFPGEDGLLGNGILARYRVTIDGIRGRLWLQR